jgi:hypothetical protein
MKKYKQAMYACTLLMKVTTEEKVFVQGCMLPGLYKIKVNINKTFVLYLHLGS